MDAVSNIANAASKAIWGEQPSQTTGGTTTTTGNETLGSEPKAGELGNVSAGEPYDKGNSEPIPDRTAATGGTGTYLSYGSNEKASSSGEPRSSMVDSTPDTISAQGPAVTSADKPSSSGGAVVSGSTPSTTKEATDRSTSTPNRAFGKTEGISETEKAAQDDGKYGKTEGVSETESAAKKDGALEDGGPGHTSTQDSKDKASGAATASHLASKDNDKPQTDHTEPTSGSGTGTGGKGEAPQEGSEEAEKKKFAEGQIHLLEKDGISKEAVEAGQTKYGHVSSGDSKPEPAEVSGGGQTPGTSDSTATSSTKPTVGAVDTNQSAGEKMQHLEKENTSTSTPVRDTPDRFQHDSKVTDPEVSPSTSTQDAAAKDESGKPSLKDKIKAKLHRNKD